MEKKTKVGGPRYEEGASFVTCYITREKKQTDIEAPCLVHFHGGGAIAGDASNDNFLCARYAVECHVTVINVNYRLAPEHKAPSGILDAYAAVKWVLNHPKDLKIDVNRVGLLGYDAGGYIASGCAMHFAKKDEDHLLRF